MTWLLLGGPPPSFPAGTLTSLLPFLSPSCCYPDLTAVIQGKELADFLPAFGFLGVAYFYVRFSPSWMFKPTHLQLFISQIWAWGSSLVIYIWVPLHTFSLAEEEMLIFSQNKIAIGQPEVLSSAQLRTGRNSNT